MASVFSLQRLQPAHSFSTALVQHRHSCQHGVSSAARNSFREEKLRRNTFQCHKPLSEHKARSLQRLEAVASDDDGPSLAPFQRIGPAIDAETLQELEQDHPRRTLLVAFTCNKCDGRTERLVNPVAWKKGMVFCQCSTCLVWHKLADAANLIEEIRFVDEPQS